VPSRKMFGSVHERRIAPTLNKREIHCMHGLFSFTKRHPDLYLSSGIFPFPPIVSLHAERAFHPSQDFFTPSIRSILGCQP